MKSKGSMVVIGVLAAFLVISVLHIWLNIGFNKIFPSGDKGQETFMVGFLPVT